MIDWHSHLLPRMDDGSKSVEESLAMLARQAEQGIQTVIATPHFYANDESIASFLSRREKSASALFTELNDTLPQVLLGAEVRYFPGISRMEGLKDLRIQGTKLLLLEMPMMTWSGSMIRELMELSGMSGIKLVMAHVERYRRFQKMDVWEQLVENDILIQVNADFFTTFGSRRKALSLLKQGGIHLIGSDCHNLTSRPPLAGTAYACIEKKLGSEFITQMNEYGAFLLGQNKL